MNETVPTLKARAHVGLQFKNLDYGHLRPVAYVDGSVPIVETNYLRLDM
jgi:hypothetical protein